HRSGGSDGTGELHLSTGSGSHAAQAFLVDGAGDLLGRIACGHGDLAFNAAGGDVDDAGSGMAAVHRRDGNGVQLLGANHASGHVAQADVDGFVGVGADLEGGGAEGTIQQLAATEAGGFGDTVQFGGQL